MGEAGDYLVGLLGRKMPDAPVTREQLASDLRKERVLIPTLPALDIAIALMFLGSRAISAALLSSPLLARELRIGVGCLFPGRLVLAHNGRPLVYMVQSILGPQEQCFGTLTRRSMAEEKRLRYADMGINLGDPVFQGVYHGRRAHDDDLEQVVQRALDMGCVKLMVTGSDLIESAHAVELAKRFPGTCYATVGVHPCASKEFDQKMGGLGKGLDELKAMVIQARESGYAVAFGEIGLDYDRLFLSPKETQLKYFEAQLDLAVELDMPLFLHSRACSEDFESLLNPRLDRLPKRGLVHSFTGTLEEMQRLVAMGFDIGINGCSMKTDENVAVVKEVPLEHLQIETDGPWCEMRASHASAKYMDGAPELPSKAVRKEKWQRGSMVKGRNESATIAHVAHVIGRIKGISTEEVCEASWANSTKMFGLGT